MTTTTPTNGVDRCDCGCKYWEHVHPSGGGSSRWQCIDCGDRFALERTSESS